MNNQIQEIVDRFDERFTYKPGDLSQTSPKTTVLMYDQSKDIKDFLIFELTTLIEKQRKEIEGLSKNYIWDNGECSICGFNSFEEENHYCMHHNSALNQVLSLKSLQ